VVHLVVPGLESRVRRGPPAHKAAAVSAGLAAAAAAERGWHVFPIRAGCKKPPLVDDWEHRASADPEYVARRWPGNANVGIACGPSDLVVVDLDTHGTLPAAWHMPGIADGRDVLAQLCEWAGQPWAATYWVATPAGGWHLYFTAPGDYEVRNSAGLLGPMIDIRGAGGYVVGAGSAVDGKPYDLLDGMDPAPLPAWITRMLAAARSAKAGNRTPGALSRRVAGLVRAVESAPEGQRNDTLYWAACRAAELDGAERDAAADALADAAGYAGLSPLEARRTMDSAMGGDQ
jgi:Bifunctional DNA primase/polymerase, N-terminal